MSRHHRRQQLKGVAAEHRKGDFFNYFRAWDDAGLPRPTTLRVLCVICGGKDNVNGAAPCRACDTHGTVSITAEHLSDGAVILRV